MIQGAFVAEDTSINHHSHSQNDDAIVHDVRGVEKTELERWIFPVTENSSLGPLQLPQSNSVGLLAGNSAESTTCEPDDKDDFPEGGLKAWSVVLGSFCGTFSVFGIINSTGVLLEYLSAHQLQGYSSSQIGWIFGINLFFCFFLGAPVGPIFDAYGPKALVFAGSVLSIVSMFLLGLCTRKRLLLRSLTTANHNRILAFLRRLLFTEWSCGLHD
jgi:hypothetical protein